MKKLLTLLLAVLCLSTGFTLTAARPAAASSADLTVMTRNLYLGADVGEALKRMPNVAAAAQFMWDQVAETNFTVRSKALASEAATNRPSLIALEEATTWVCTPGAGHEPVVIYDFTKQYIAATKAAGVPYVLASANNAVAFSKGYAIEPIVGISVVNDPKSFQPLFGTDTASCGFRIGDALLVRADLAHHVTEVGSFTYAKKSDIIPGFITVQRGYTWANFLVGATTVKVVATHLESLWNPNEVPASVTQIKELIQNFSTFKGPLVVMGDFNADPRDPRPVGAPNPGDQPVANAVCTGHACNPYWLMVNNGFADAGPDPTNPKNFSWGANANLAGPDPQRVQAALSMGNAYGFTERLDYVFTRGGPKTTTAGLVGNKWPVASDLWSCSYPDQVANTKAMAQVLKVAIPSGGVCFPTDHAGVLASIAVNPSSSTAVIWWSVAGFLVLIVFFAILWVSRRKKAATEV